MDEEFSNVESKIRLKAWMVAGGIILLWGLSWLLIDVFIYNSSARGTFGDKFGAINALFTGLALAGVIYTILLQRFDLKKQKEESELQRFETSFFQLLSFHHKLVDTIRYTPPGQDFSGRKAFEKNYLDFRNTEKHKEQSTEELLGRFFKNYFNNLVNYFRNFSYIVQYIHESNIKTKIKYIGILRAQLSNYEHAFLFYSGLSEKGCEKLKPLIEKYSLLENMDYDLLVNFNHYELYDKNAFGSTPPPQE